MSHLHSLHPVLNSFASVILGGAGIGSAVGLLAHYARSLTGDKPPVVEVPQPQNPGENTPPVVPPAL